jgi:hypothetical protein
MMMGFCVGIIAGDPFFQEYLANEPRILESLEGTVDGGLGGNGEIAIQCEHQLLDGGMVITVEQIGIDRISLGCHSQPLRLQCLDNLLYYPIDHKPNAESLRNFLNYNISKINPR